MNYVWEMVVHLMEKSVKKGDMFFQQAEECSPYYEQAFQNINESDCCESFIQINSLYRFEGVFGELLNPNLHGDEEYKKYLFDILLHFLCEIDLMKGLNKREYFIHKLEQDIMKGYYGEKMVKQLGLLSSDARYIIYNHLLTQLQAGSSVLLFSRTVRALFADAIVYKSNIEKKQVLIYIGERQNELIQTKMDLAAALFLPVGHSIRLFYEHHFGIMDVPETLQLGDIEIF